MPDQLLQTIYTRVNTGVFPSGPIWLQLEGQIYYGKLTSPKEIKQRIDEARPPESEGDARVQELRKQEIKADLEKDEKIPDTCLNLVDAYILSPYGLIRLPNIVRIDADRIAAWGFGQPLVVVDR